MSDGFSRTLETAAQAEATARMLSRVAEGRGAITCPDIDRLRTLAQRYTDYAAALRETVAVEHAPADPPAALL